VHLPQPEYDSRNRILAGRVHLVPVLTEITLGVSSNPVKDGGRGKGWLRSPRRCHPLAAARLVCPPATACLNCGLGLPGGAHRRLHGRLHRREPGPARGAISFWPWWSAEHCRRTRRSVREAVSSVVIYPLRLSSCGRDVGVDSLAAELVVNRR